MTFHVLVTCSANVCRSPLVAAAFVRAIALSELSRVVVVGTGGVDVLPGDPVCPDIVKLADGHGLRSRDLVGHRARALTLAELDTADLVLAADRRVRSSIVKRAPEATSRTFTVREAARLLRAAADQVGGRTTAEDRLRSYVEAMNASRGLVDLPRTRYLPTPSTPWRRLVVHAHDLPDAHQNERAPHRTVYRLATAGAQQLAHGFSTSVPALRS
jgi:protein-tyrosine phosphatase